MNALESFRDYFSILEISPNAGPIEIRRAYKRKAIETHPDKAPGNLEKSDDDFKKVREAYEILINPSKKREYLLYYREYKRVVEKENYLKEIERKRRHANLIFYYCKEPQEVQKSIQKLTFDKLMQHYKDISSNWCVAPNPKAIHIHDDLTRHKLRSVIEEMYHCREANKKISGFEFHGELVIPRIKDLAEHLPECLVTLQLLLHDLPHHEDNYLVGYALYVMNPKFEIWLEDSWTEFALLMLQIQATYQLPFSQWPTDVLYPFSRLQLCLKVMKMTEAGTDAKEIHEELGQKIPLSQIQSMIRLVNK